MIVKLLTAHNLEFLSLKGGCRGLSVSTLVKKSNVGILMPWLIFKRIFSKENLAEDSNDINLPII